MRLRSKKQLQRLSADMLDAACRRQNRELLAATLRVFNAHFLFCLVA